MASTRTKANAKKLNRLKQRRKLPKMLAELASYGYSLDRPPRYNSPAFPSYQSARSLTRQLAVSDGIVVPENCKLKGNQTKKKFKRKPAVKRTEPSTVAWLPRDEWERQTVKFYKSQAWKEARYDVLRRDGGSCACCGARASDGVQVHVDHIKPRSRYPELQLDTENMQVLCEDCNFGKSNYYNDDWRVKMV